MSNESSDSCSDYETPGTPPYSSSKNEASRSIYELNVMDSGIESFLFENIESHMYSQDTSLVVQSIHDSPSGNEELKSKRINNHAMEKIKKRHDDYLVEAQDRKIFNHNSTLKSKVRDTVRAIESKYGKTTKSNPDLYKHASYTVNKRNDAQEYDDKDVAELSELLTDTNCILSRNCNLRASLTISMRGSKRRKNNSTKEENHGGLSLGYQRSIRLAPKTVERLAAKFDSIIIGSKKPKKIWSSNNKSVVSNTISLDKEVNLLPNDISKIISELKSFPENSPTELVNKLDVNLSESHIENEQQNGHANLLLNGLGRYKKIKKHKISKWYLKQGKKFENGTTCQCQGFQNNQSDEISFPITDLASATRNKNVSHIMHRGSVNNNQFNLNNNSSENDCFHHVSLVDGSTTIICSDLQKLKAWKSKNELSGDIVTDNHQICHLEREFSDKGISRKNNDSNVVMARPAIVLEDQVDSLSYVQDDGDDLSWQSRTGRGLYESIAGSILNLANIKNYKNNVGSDMNKEDGQIIDYDEYMTSKIFADIAGHSEGCQDILSYTLAKLGQAMNGTMRNQDSSCNSEFTTKMVIGSSSSLDDDNDEFNKDISTEMSRFSTSSHETLSDWSDAGTNAEPKNFDGVNETWQHNIKQHFNRNSKIRSSSSSKRNSSSSLRKPRWRRFQPLSKKSAKCVIKHKLNLQYDKKSNDINDQDMSTTSYGKSSEDLYESIYDIIEVENAASFTDDEFFQDVVSDNVESTKVKSKFVRSSPVVSKNLTKMAESATKRIKKLRRNWSLTKGDISRSFSRIKQNNRPGLFTSINSTIFDAYEENTVLSSLRQRASANFVQNSKKYSFRTTNKNNLRDKASTFYITLTLHNDAGTKTELNQDVVNIDESGAYSASSSSSTASYMSLPEESVVVLPRSDAAAKQRRRNSSNWLNCGGKYFAVVRPTEPPPSPPSISRREELTTTTHNKSPFPSTDEADPLCSNAANITECITTDEFASNFRNINEELAINSGENSISFDLLDTFLVQNRSPNMEDDTNLEENYVSNLFETEPLYQFYDAQQIKRDLISGKLENMYECVLDVAASDDIGPHGAKHDTDIDEGISDICDDSENEDVFCNKPSGEQQQRIKDIIVDDSLGSYASSSRTGSCNSSPRSSHKPFISGSTAVDVIRDKLTGKQRSMWSELPDVISSGILEIISTEHKQLMEAKFEVISSEASYLKSLNILISHFMQSPMLLNGEEYGTISKRDYRMIFSDILQVRHVSEKFLKDLEKQWNTSLLLNGLCEVVNHHAETNFSAYVKYCSKNHYHDRILKKLRLENPKFVDALALLESSTTCQSLRMQSFLMLPMQRITRLPMLLIAIQNQLKHHLEEGQQNATEYIQCCRAIYSLKKVAQECNESTRSMERMEEMLLLNQQLDFRDVKAVPLISASRWLVRRGNAIRLSWKDSNSVGVDKLTFGRNKLNRQSVTFFLFTDLLLIAKRKSDDHKLVLDYCPRNFVQLSKFEDIPDPSFGGISKLINSDINVLHVSAWLTLLQNHDGKTVEWLVSFSCEAERDRWIEAVTPPKSNISTSKEDEQIYEAWDRPRIEAIQDYIPTSSESESSNELLELRLGEEANVIRKQSNSGWYYAERLVDNQCGWIPINVTKELDSSHVRSRNFKQRYEFLKIISKSAACSSCLRSETISSSSTSLSNSEKIKKFVFQGSDNSNFY